MYSFIEEVANNQANIKVIGIGGGGCNAVERMLTRQMSGVEFIACNTDMQSLQQYHAPTCLQLGGNLTRGLGAGGNPKVGRAAAMEDEEMLRSHLTGADMVFITAGMGGGTGTGGAPVVAQVARDLEILTIAVVTLPFRFEGRRRQKIAEAGIRDLEDFVDTLIVIPNEKLLAAVEPDTTVKDAFMKADEILSNAVQGISDLITEPGEVNVDFADVRTIMTDMGKAILGTGVGDGDTRALQAVESAISSTLLEDLSIDGARGILMNITSGDDLSMIELNQACDRVYQAADDEALIIFGHVINPEYDGRMKITVIATGFEEPKVRERSRSMSSELRKFEMIQSAPRHTEAAPQTHAVQEVFPDPPPRHQVEQYTPDVSPENTAQSQSDTAYQEPLFEESETSEISDETDYEPVETMSETQEDSLYADQQEIDQSEAEHCPDSAFEDTDEFKTVTPATNEVIEEPTSHLLPEPSPLRIAQPEPSDEPALAPPATPRKQFNQPELDPAAPRATSIQEEFPSVPDYSRRNLGQGNYKKEVNLSKSTQRIFYGDINTPAFLRRKAD